MKESEYILVSDIARLYTAALMLRNTTDDERIGKFRIAAIMAVEDWRCVLGRQLGQFDP